MAENLKSYKLEELADVYGVDINSDVCDFVETKNTHIPSFMIQDGGVYQDAEGNERPSCTFFALSRKTAEAHPEVTSAEALSDFVLSNLDSARFVLPEDITTEAGEPAKFGAIFLSQSTRKSLADLLAKAQSMKG